MRIQKSKSKKSLILVTVVLLALVGAAAYVFAIKPKQEKSNEPPENTVNYDKPSDSQKEAGQKAKEDFIKEHETNGGTKPTNEPQGETESVAVTITSASQQDDTLQVRTIIDQIESPGTCTLTLTMGTKSVVKEANSQVLGSYSVCQGFDVPVSELGAGMWTARIEFKSTSMSGSARREIEVK